MKLEQLSCLQIDPIREDKNLCPRCKGVKDKRAKHCRKCSFKVPKKFSPNWGWNKGGHLTKEWKKKIGKGNSISLLGKHCSSKTEFKKGHIPWHQGLTKETSLSVKKISESLKGEKCYNWKGDNIKYRAIHVRIRNIKPKSEVCEYCGLKFDKLVLANISQKYRIDVNDYRWLCNSCHRKEHFRMKKEINTI